jgi:hypothetical protein
VKEICLLEMEVIATEKDQDKTKNFLKSLSYLLIFSFLCTFNINHNKRDQIDQIKKKTKTKSCKFLLISIFFISIVKW